MQSVNGSHFLCTTFLLLLFASARRAAVFVTDLVPLASTDA